MKFKVILLYCVISARPECKLCSVKYSWLFRRSTHRRRWSQYGPLWRPCFEAPVGQFGFPTQPAAKCSSACSRRRRHSPGGNFTLSPNGASPHQALLTPPRCLIPTMPEQTPATISFRENTQPRASCSRPPRALSALRFLVIYGQGMSCLGRTRCTGVHVGLPPEPRGDFWIKIYAPFWRSL